MLSPSRLLMFTLLSPFGLGDQAWEFTNLLDSKPNWSDQVRVCLTNCRAMLGGKGSKDMNYCVEGCRILVYRPIYTCVHDHCNNLGSGPNLAMPAIKYHHCVHLCKLRPNIHSPPSPTSKTNFFKVDRV